MGSSALPQYGWYGWTFPLLVRHEHDHAALPVEGDLKQARAPA